MTMNRCVSMHLLPFNDDDPLEERKREYVILSLLGRCWHCKMKIGDGEDVYMYKGNRAFCSHGCRQQQIHDDKQLKRNNKLHNTSSTVANNPDLVSKS